MKRPNLARLLLLAAAFAVVVGCGGASGAVLNTLNPFAGTYNGNVTFTNTAPPNNVQPLTLQVAGNGHVTGSYIDPNTSDSSLAGNIDVNGTITGTTLSGATPGTFTLTLTSNVGAVYSGNGTFTVNSVGEPVTFSVTKS
jgi:hypothetical protein